MNNAVKILTYCSACFITELLAILAAVFIEQMKTNKKLKQKDNNSRYNFRKKNLEVLEEIYSRFSFRYWKILKFIFKSSSFAMFLINSN